MTKGTWLLMAVVLALVAAGGVWAGAHALIGSADCCLEPTSPSCGVVSPPCCTQIPPEPSCCCDDSTCEPGSTPQRAAECLPAPKIEESYCPPCPFCW
jgi:hypothetical protein